MAFVALKTGDSGDLNVAAYQYGYFDDTVLVLEAQPFTIKTYEGNDRIDLSRLLTQPNASFIFAGSGDDTVIGSAGGELVYDGSGNDKVFCGGENDEVRMGSGNDFYDGGGGNRDQISGLYKSFDGFGNLEANTAAVRIDLAIVTAQDTGAFGIDRIVGFEWAEGGSGNDQLSGNGSDNKLSGYLGADQLSGRIGNDELAGGAGGDVLTGGAGADMIYCGQNDSARDRVIYSSYGDSPAVALNDQIFEFHPGAAATDDRIDLSLLDGNLTAAGNQALTWRGTGAFSNSAVAEVRIEDLGANVVVSIDMDTDTAAEMVFLVIGVGALLKADFIL